MTFGTLSDPNGSLLVEAAWSQSVRRAKIGVMGLDMLAAFREWFRFHQEELEAKGFRLQFHGETEEQTVKSNSLNLTFGRYNGCIYVWERGDGNIELVDTGCDASTPPEECADFVELQFAGHEELAMALSSFFAMLSGLPDQDVPMGTALRLYWQRLPAEIRLSLWTATTDAGYHHKA